MKAINKELGIFQDKIIISDDEKKLRQKESLESSKNNAKYDYQYSTGSRR
jgi:hypothetical protein